MCVCVCVRVRACVRACVRVRACVCTSCIRAYTHVQYVHTVCAYVCVLYYRTNVLPHFPSSLFITTTSPSPSHTLSPSLPLSLSLSLSPSLPPSPPSLPLSLSLSPSLSLSHPPSFTQYGSISDVRLVKTQSRGRANAFAYVEYTTTAPVERALQTDRCELAGRIMFVSQCKESGYTGTSQSRGPGFKVRRVRVKCNVTIRT